MEEQDRQPFSAWLADHAKGTANTELTDRLSDLVDAVADTGKPGTLTLTVKASVAHKDDPNGPLVVTAEVTSKLPQDARAVLYFNTARGLSRRDTRQQDLPFESEGANQ